MTGYKHLEYIESTRTQSIDTRAFSGGPEIDEQKYLPGKIVGGKNLFDKNNRIRVVGYFASTGTTWSYASAAYSNKIPCKPNTTYTARYNGNSTQAVLGFGSCSTDDEPSESQTSVTVTQGIRQNSPTINTPVTITTGANDKWLIVAYNITEPQHTDMADNLQIEEGSTATTYEPYSQPHLQHYIINPIVNRLNINNTPVYTYAEWSAVSTTPQIAPMRVNEWVVGDSLSTKSFDDVFQNGMTIILPVMYQDVVRVKIYGDPKIGSALRKIGASVNGVISVGDTPYTLVDGEFTYTVPIGVDHLFITLGQAPQFDDWSCLDNCWVTVNQDLPPQYKNKVYGYAVQKG